VLSRLMMLSDEILTLFVQIRFLLRFVAQVIKKLLKTTLLLSISFSGTLLYLLLELDKVIPPLSVSEFKPCLSILPSSLRLPELPL
jgi:hypothetical protein